MCESSEKKLGKSDLQGWVRTGLVIVSMIGAVYYAKGQMDAHIGNKEIHSTVADNADRFVLRREYDNNIAGLRDDLRYLRNRIDMLIDRVDERSKKEGK